MPIVRLGVPTCANLRVEGSTGIASVTDAARQGWDRRRPCRSHSPLLRGMACLYIHSAASLSFAPAEKKRRGIKISRRPCTARLPDFPCQGKPGETPSGTPQGRSRCRRNERESAMPGLAANPAAGAGQPSQSCLEKHRFGLSSALASALENCGQPTFSE